MRHSKIIVAIGDKRHYAIFLGVTKDDGIVLKIDEQKPGYYLLDLYWEYMKY